MWSWCTTALSHQVGTRKRPIIFPKVSLTRSRRRKNLLGIVRWQLLLATSAARFLKWGSWTKWLWMSCPSCSGPANVILVQYTGNICWRTRMWSSGGTEYFTCAIRYAAPTAPLVDELVQNAPASINWANLLPRNTRRLVQRRATIHNKTALCLVTVSHSLCYASTQVSHSSVAEAC